MRSRIEEFCVSFLTTEQVLIPPHSCSLPPRYRCGITSLPSQLALGPGYAVWANTSEALLCQAHVLKVPEPLWPSPLSPYLCGLQHGHSWTHQSVRMVRSFSFLLTEEKISLEEKPPPSHRSWHLVQCFFLKLQHLFTFVTHLSTTWPRYFL